MGEAKHYSVWDGNYKYSKYYDKNGRKTGESVDRYSHWDGRYLGTDHYDSNGKKKFRSYESPHGFVE